MKLLSAVLRRAGLLAAGCLLGLLAAEAAAAFALPKPVPFKLPLLRSEAVPSYGFRLEPHQTGYALSSPVTVNRWGFRGGDWAEEKSPGTFRIVLLGDSYVFGTGVRDEETFAARLETELNSRAQGNERFEVLNFGMSGYDTGHEIEALRHEALRFAPDMAVLFFFINDLLYVEDYGFYPDLIAKERLEFKVWKWRLREILRRSRFVMAVWDGWKHLQRNVMTEVMETYIKRSETPPAAHRREWQFISKRLEEFKRLADENGFMPVFCVIPTAEEIRRPMKFLDYAVYLNTLAAEAGLKVVSITNDLARSGLGASELLIPYDHHFTAAGHAVIAASLEKSIMELKNENPAPVSDLLQ